MKITNVRATPVNIPFKAPYRYALGSTASLTKTVVEVETDEGVTGLGEYASGDGTHVIERLGQRLVGLDPLDLNECERRCVPDVSFNLWEHLEEARRGFGAIEMALWDLRGRAEGRSLATLLGGAVRTHVPFTEYFAYRVEANGVGGESSPLAIARYCERMVEQYDAPSFEGKVATVGLREELEMIGEVRRAIGPERMLRLDANGGWTYATAREALWQLEPLNIRNVEDPVDSFEEMARLRSVSPSTFSTHDPDLRRAVGLGTPDYFVVNLVELGGIRRTVEFIGSCRLFGFGVWFHSGETGIASAAYIQVAAAVDWLTEPSQALFHWYADDVVEQGTFCPRSGVVAVPDGPGLGITLDRSALARCHQRYRDEGPFPSGMGARPETVVGSFGGLSRR